MKSHRSILCCLLAAALCCLLAACSPQSTPEETPSPSPTASASSQEETRIEIVIPASYLEGMTLQEVQEAAKEQGADSVTQDPDGSFRYVMTATAHRRLVSEMRATLTENVSQIPTGENYPSIQSASLSDDLTALTLTADREAYQNSNDRTIVRAVWPSLEIYYYFNKEDPSDKSLAVTVNDTEGAIIESFSWPEEATEEPSASSQDSESSSQSSDSSSEASSSESE